MNIDGEDETGGEPLEIEQEEAGEGEPPEQDNEAEIGFADDEQEEETPLVRQLRTQLRDMARRQHQQVKPPVDDPEPQVPDEPDAEKFGWDLEQYNTASKAWRKAVADHAEWKVREARRTEDAKRVQDETARAVEQQKKSLGVADYDAHAETVHAALSEQQIAILVNGADNPARLIYALGRSQHRLDQLAAETNLAKFAVMLGRMEREIKVTKRTPPNAEVKVRGATASVALTTSDKELERLEKAAERSGDRTAVIAYKRQMKQQRAA